MKLLSPPGLVMHSLGQNECLDSSLAQDVQKARERSFAGLRKFPRLYEPFAIDMSRSSPTGLHPPKSGNSRSRVCPTSAKFEVVKAAEPCLNRESWLLVAGKLRSDHSTIESGAQGTWPASLSYSCCPRSLPAVCHVVL